MTDKLFGLYKLKNSTTNDFNTIATNKSYKVVGQIEERGKNIFIFIPSISYYALTKDELLEVIDLMDEYKRNKGK